VLLEQIMGILAPAFFGRFEKNHGFFVFFGRFYEILKSRYSSERIHRKSLKNVDFWTWSNRQYLGFSVFIKILKNVKKAKILRIFGEIFLKKPQKRA
jgi:hypothetical protein